MIYSLEGIVREINPEYVVISCNGVGYLAYCSANTAGALGGTGSKAFLYTVLNVKENAVELAGFATAEEREMYKMLCTVSGVGSKVALSILSTFTPDRIALLIAGGDSKGVTAAPGVGPRLAQRIVLELKDKVGAVDMSGQAAMVSAVRSSSSSSEAVEALTALGFSVAEASKAVASLDASLSVEELISGALRKLAR